MAISAVLARAAAIRIRLRRPIIARRPASACWISSMIFATPHSSFNFTSSRIPSGFSRNVIMPGNSRRRVGSSRSAMARGSLQSRIRSASWTQTRMPSRVKRTSVSMASAPAAVAASSAETVFSAASAAPPRWAITSGPRHDEPFHKSTIAFSVAGETGFLPQRYYGRYESGNIFVEPLPAPAPNVANQAIVFSICSTAHSTWPLVMTRGGARRMVFSCVSFASRPRSLSE